MKIGTIGSIALLGGIGYVIYKFYKGDWKVPSLPGLPDIIKPIIEAIPGEPEVTIKETGVPGAVGDIIYNITYPDLRERAADEYHIHYHETQELEESTTPPGETPKPPDPEGVFSRSVAATVSKDIHGAGAAAYLVPGLNAVTIGAGLAAIKRQGDWLDTLSPAAKTEAERRESEQRLMKVATDPTTTAAAIISGAILGPIPMALTLGRDLLRVATTAPPPPKKATTRVVVTPEIWHPPMKAPLPTAETRAKIPESIQRTEFGRVFMGLNR